MLSGGFESQELPDRHRLHPDVVFLLRQLFLFYPVGTVGLDTEHTDIRRCPFNRSGTRWARVPAAARQANAAPRYRLCSPPIVPVWVGRNIFTACVKPAGCHPFSNLRPQMLEIRAPGRHRLHPKVVFVLRQLFLCSETQM